MTRFLLRRRVAAAVAATLVTTVALSGMAGAASTARKVSIRDAAGDVQLVDSTRSAFAPSLDIRTLQAEYLPASKALRVKVTFTDLLPLRAPSAEPKQFLHVVLRGRTSRFHLVRVMRSESKKRDGVDVMIYKALTQPGTKLFRVCRGATMHAAPAADHWTATFPIRCLKLRDDVRRVRLGVVTLATYYGQDSLGMTSWMRIR